METQSKRNDLAPAEYNPGVLNNNGNIYSSMSFPKEEMVTAFQKLGMFKNKFNELLPEAGTTTGKKSFLVFKHNKYITVPTENIAFFYVKYGCSVIVCLDKHEYSVNYSLEQIQNLVTSKQFFRLNRQYLINFNAVKEVEHYFARKLLVGLVIQAPEKLLVPKEKASIFLHWLENR